MTGMVSAVDSPRYNTRSSSYVAGCYCSDVADVLEKGQARPGDSGYFSEARTEMKAVCVGIRWFECRGCLRDMFSGRCGSCVAGEREFYIHELGKGK